MEKRGKVLPKTQKNFKGWDIATGNLAKLSRACQNTLFF